jgi:hypothetical protein
VGWINEYIVATGRSPALWLLLGFLTTYAVTRWVTVRIRRRASTGEGESGPIKDVHIAGVHVHHQVWGILLALVTGLLEFRFRPGSPWVEVLALLFGAGAALALDEFALWLHLEDVYWSQEGRKSIDAVLVASVFGLVLLSNANLFGVGEDTVRRGYPFVLAVIAVHLCYCIVCLLKGKIVTGLLGLVVPVLGLVGAIRLGHPESFWARRFYGEPKVTEASSRHDRMVRRRERLRDAFSGGRGLFSSRG